MSRFLIRKRIAPYRRRSPIVLLLLILLWCIAIAWELANAMEPPNINTVDPVPSQLGLGEELYLENCSTCHIAVPPSVLPTQTWKQLLLDSNHYGSEIQLLVDPSRLLVWNYLQAFSRPIGDTQVPYRVGQSRYFKALHPRVQLSEPISLDSCMTCHPGANAYNFRSLTADWENSE